MATSSPTETETFDQLLEQARKERERIQTELKEIDLLIQQTTGEVDKLSQRNMQARNRLRQVEGNLDTVPRQDIKDAYTSVMDTQQRLFTMRGQLEKLQSDQKRLTRYLNLIQDLLSFEGPRPSPEQAKEEPSQPLVVRIIEAQERERQRLSRQMHDGPAQSLTNLILQAEICERLLETDSDRAREELATLKNAVAETFQKVKVFILNLRPMMLDDLGVIPTLRRYVDGFSDNRDIATHLTVTGKDRRIASHKEVTIFRLIQELMNNAVDYGDASSIQINLDMGEGQVRASVEDNGSGFELTESLSSGAADKMGLATMRERIEMLDGTIDFDSSIGKGTKVSFELPIS